MIRPRRTLSLAAALLVPSLLACQGGDADAGTPNDESPQSDGSMSAALPSGAEALSLLGDPLEPAPLDSARHAEFTSNLDAARADLESDPGNADAMIWVGRRLAYLGHYRDAIDVYTDGIAAHPNDARFLRHRGHRWITVRELDRAIEDLSAAARLIEGTEDEVEPDGLPNARGIPTSTLHFNIWYHLALAHYLKGEFDEARRAWESCMDVSTNDDARVATAHWLYMTLRRLGEAGEATAVVAPFGPETEVIENGSYLQLVRMYRGETTPEELLGPAGDVSLESATLGYGVGNWHFYGGDEEGALEIFRRIVDGRAQWPAFGYIAAEAELARRADG